MTGSRRESRTAQDRPSSEETPNFTEPSAWVVPPMAEPKRLNQAVLVGVCRGRRARRNVELREDVAHVPVDRLLAQEQLFRDRLVGLAAGDEAQHLELARRQTMRPRRRTLLGDRVQAREFRRGSQALEHFPSSV